MIRSLAPEAVERLTEIIRDPTVKVDSRLRAIEIILERTYGKAFYMEDHRDNQVRVIIDV